MDVHEAIKKRYSVRKYQDKEVPDDLIGAVIEAGMNAPSAGNKQNWRFVVIKNPKKKELIAKHSKKQYWMTAAPALIVVCSDEDTNKRFYKERGKFYSVQNCAAAIENMSLAAVALGLGTCWVGAFDDVEVAEAINAAGVAKVQAIMTLGYPTKELHNKSIVNLDRVMFLENYGGKVKSFSRFFYDWSDIADAQAKKITKSLKQVILSELKQYTKDFEKNWASLSKKMEGRLRRKW